MIRVKSSLTLTRYFGSELSENSLLPGGEAQLGVTRFEEWLRSYTLQAPASNPQPAVGAAAAGSTPFQNHEFRISEVPPGSALLVGDVAVFNIAVSFCATQDKCTHRQGPLSRGKLDGSAVTCPLHGAQFDVCTGAVLHGPARESLKTYRVIVDGEIGRIDTGQVQHSEIAANAAQKTSAPGGPFPRST